MLNASKELPCVNTKFVLRVQSRTCAKTFISAHVSGVLRMRQPTPQIETGRHQRAQQLVVFCRHVDVHESLDRFRRDVQTAVHCLNIHQDALEDALQNIAQSAPALLEAADLKKRAKSLLENASAARPCPCKLAADSASISV